MATTVWLTVSTRGMTREQSLAKCSVLLPEIWRWFVVVMESLLRSQAVSTVVVVCVVVMVCLSDIVCKEYGQIGQCIRQ